ncbi:hypothetical protein VNO78_23480 [Psophocarpus tetragonolobus]|uniref:Secreted protein n=1 Tax=Psophocarpus tetragonolobus TaxID=3891 RepID=A0AAN9S3M1_PSOTE
MHFFNHICLQTASFAILFIAANNQSGFVLQCRGEKRRVCAEGLRIAREWEGGKFNGGVGRGKEGGVGEGLDM